MSNLTTLLLISDIELVRETADAYFLLSSSSSSSFVDLLI